MTYKFVISKETKNALTETNPNNLIFSSDYSTLKYYSSGYTSVTFTSADRFGDGFGKFANPIYHNLGYYPYFDIYVLDSDGKFTTAPIRRTGATTFYQVFAYVSTTQLNIGVKISSSPSGSVTYYFYYFIYRNDLGL